MQQGTQVEEVRQQLHLYLKKSNNEIRLDKNDKRKAYRQYINPDFNSISSKQIQICPEVAKIENPVLEVAKIIKKSCQLTPYASHLIKYVNDPIDKVGFSFLMGLHGPSTDKIIEKTLKTLLRNAFKLSWSFPSISRMQEFTDQIFSLTKKKQNDMHVDL